MALFKEGRDAMSARKPPGAIDGKAVVFAFFAATVYFSPSASSPLTKLVFLALLVATTARRATHATAATNASDEEDGINAAPRRAAAEDSTTSSVIVPFA
ncbi:unnamed protein product [Bathycoccus prasinos]